MEFSEAFRETMFRFRLKGSDIAEKSGLTQAQVSDFRNGKNLRIDNLERILKALPPDALSYLLDRVKDSLSSGSP